MVEVWKKIEGWNGYSVSSYGNVKRDKKKSGAYLKLSKKQNTDKTGKKTNYYTYWVSLTNNGYSKYLKVSRLVALAFIPNPDNLPIVHHKDKNPLNNNVDNLMWATNLENCQSINTLRDIGGVRVTASGYVADFIYYGKRYDFYNPDKDKCQDWLNARRVEIENNLNLTELDCHNKYKGYLDRDPKSNSISARIQYKTKTYSFTNPNEDKCQDWLNARYIEIMNGLNLTELDIRKKGRGTIIKNTSAATYYACIRIDGTDYRGTFTTREEAQKYMDECYKKYKC